MDPWKHRSLKMQCATCMWNVEKAKVGKLDNTTELTGPESEITVNMVKPSPLCIGRCRRHAPTMNGYPVVFETDWCGDHKLDENKV